MRACVVPVDILDSFCPGNPDGGGGQAGEGHPPSSLPPGPTAGLPRTGSRTADSSHPVAMVMTEGPRVGDLLPGRVGRHRVGACVLLLVAPGRTRLDQDS